MVEEIIQERRLLWAVRAQDGGVYGQSDMIHVRFPDGHRRVDRPPLRWEGIVRNDALSLRFIRYAQAQMDFSCLMSAEITKKTIQKNQKEQRGYHVLVPT